MVISDLTVSEIKALVDVYPEGTLKYRRISIFSFTITTVRIGDAKVIRSGYLDKVSTYVTGKGSRIESVKEIFKRK